MQKGKLGSDAARGVSVAVSLLAHTSRELGSARRALAGCLHGGTARLRLGACSPRCRRSLLAKSTVGVKAGAAAYVSTSRVMPGLWVGALPFRDPTSWTPLAQQA